jgi:DNA primase
MKWGVGGSVDDRPEYRYYKGWIIIPIIQDGILKNYFMRNPKGSQKMYGPYPRPDLLAGLDLIHSVDEPVYVLEGIFKAMAMNKIKKQAVAALANRILPGQLEILKRFKKIIIVPDNPKNEKDISGEMLIKTALPLIYNSEIYVCTLPKTRKDSDECTIDELLWATTYSEIPIYDYIINKLAS